jgi:mannitol 2-dehydrogenase
MVDFLPVEPDNASLLMKLRFLNGGHAIVAYPGGPVDIGGVHKARAHPLIRAFLEKVEQTEIIPHVPPVPDTDLQDCFRAIVQRFSAPEVAGTKRRLCPDGSNRQPRFIVPSLRDNLARGAVPDGLAPLSALWCRYCAGTTDSGTPIPPNDANRGMLTAHALAAKADPQVWLAMVAVYGDTGRHAGFAARFAHHPADVRARGTPAALTDCLARTTP